MVTGCQHTAQDFRIRVSTPLRDHLKTAVSVLITRQSDFDDLCEEIRAAGIVGFDTEFLSEFTYRPDLCLLQFATPNRCVAVDPLEVGDLSAWWDLMTDDTTRIVVHGSREEIKFCLTNAGRRPRLLWDVQIAEGFRGRSFPLGYEALVKRVVGKTAHGRETRADWRKRPLTQAQIDYAIDDVDHLLDIYRLQTNWLEKRGRVPWVVGECERLITDVEAERGPDAWMRLSGLTRLPPRELAVARAVYWWRDAEAAARNKPVRRVLRDDLIIEIARRKPKNQTDLLSTRDLNRTDFRRVADDLLEAVVASLRLTNEELPTLPPNPDDDKSHDEQVVGQLLGLALANRCAEMNVAMGLIGKSADLRHLVRWHVYNDHTGEQPRLTQGWRAEVCGNLLEDVLDGKISLRVADPQSDHPFVFERREG
jgi:ribonuclease D